MSDPFVVVGGDAAGLSAASKYKREAPERGVVVFERGRWVSYAHCGTPYFVKGEVEALADLLSLSPGDAEDRGIDLRRSHEVLSVAPDAGTVTVRGPEGEFEQPYSDLLVATGARAISAPIPGIELAGAFTLHGLDDAGALRAFLAAPDEFSVEDLGGGPYIDEDRARRYGAMDPPDEVALVGGGPVGIEMAEAFSAHDLEVHLFQRSDRPVSRYGEAVGDRIAKTLEREEVDCHFGAQVDRLRGEDGRIAGLVCADGTELDVDAALVGIGIHPNVEVVADAGVELGDSGAIAVDRYGRASVDGIYAAGDCAELPHVVTGKSTWIPLGLNANRAGRAIGATVAGDPTPVGTTAGTAVLKAFDLECGRTGLLSEAAREAGFDPVSETITAGSRSGYYPGSAETAVTLVADRDSGRLLGGTIAGEDRAAVRIDTVATALEGRMTVAELERSDLAYAPPFSPVWDPVLVAAKVLSGEIPTGDDPV